MPLDPGQIALSCNFEWNLGARPILMMLSDQALRDDEHLWGDFGRREPPQPAYDWLRRGHCASRFERRWSFGYSGSNPRSRQSTLGRGAGMGTSTNRNASRQFTRRGVRRGGRSGRTESQHE